MEGRQILVGGAVRGRDHCVTASPASITDERGEARRGHRRCIDG
jgi:hypothetical protein